MDEKVQRTRALCLDQAEGFISAAQRLVDGEGWNHIVFHLGLLALEEIGKAGMVAAQAAGRHRLDGTWIDRALDDHRRKLQWAVWSPMVRIDPADFEAARRFAERAHGLRLESLYVDPDAEVTDLPPHSAVSAEDAAEILELAAARLDHERATGVPTDEDDELLEWFFDTMEHPERSRIMLSPLFIAKYEELGHPKKWFGWARMEIERHDQEMRALTEEELKRPVPEKAAQKPRWRANITIYTPSHSVRAKVLKRWNDRNEHMQLIWTGKKDQFILQITLHDNLPISTLDGRLATISQILLACLNIASIGYFWFEPPGFEHEMFRDVRDLERNLDIKIGRGESFWGTGRAVALTDEIIDRACTCLMAFAPLSEQEAEPIFGHYFRGLAFIAKSDTYYNFDQLARQEFVGCLFEAMRHYGAWNGTQEDMDASLHAAFEPIVPALENRDMLFKSLKLQGNPDESSLGNLRTAKNLADLYLNLMAKKTWRTVVETKLK